MRENHKWFSPPRLDKYLNEFSNLYASLYKNKSKPPPLLIMGPRGVGKSMFCEVFSRLFCDEKGIKWKDLPKPVNIAAIPETLIEGQLFGYKKGSYTGATRDFDGIVKSATDAGGLLVLEEIGEISKNIQAKFLTFIEDKIYYQLGQAKPVGHLCQKMQTGIGSRR